MNLSKLTYTNTELVKFVGFALLISGMWYDLKTDFSVHKAEHKLIEYRIANLEIANGTKVITPKETKIEDGHD